MSWLVMENTPGYTPDCPPWVFELKDDAMNFAYDKIVEIAMIYHPEVYSVVIVRETPLRWCVRILDPYRLDRCVEIVEQASF